MKVYEAIQNMRRLTQQKQEFAFSFMSYSLSRDKSEGEVFVEHALLVNNAKDSRNAFQDFMLNFLDTDTGTRRQCWQPLIMSFNHTPLDGID